MKTLLQVQDVTKAYGGRPVLQDVTLSFRAGEIHALVGENGAGKSTLAGIVAGAVRPTAGRIRLDDATADYTTPRGARQAGVAFVSQELSLLGRRSVLENVFTGRIPTSLPALVSPRRMRQRFTKLMEETGLVLDPDARVDRLNAVEQEFVEILRAVNGGARLLILDEPTTATTPDQAERIYRLVNRLAARGVTVVLVSHDLDDVLRLCDRVTVLRDGRIIRTVTRGEVDKQQLINLMIGRELTDLFPARHVDGTRPVALSVAGLTRRGSYADIGFQVRAGEILGLAGLVGSGRSEVLMALAGAEPADAGTVTLDGAPVRLRSVRDAQRHGIALVPENRKLQGLHLDHSIERNITLPHLRRISRFGLIRRSRSAALAADGAGGTAVKAPSVRVPVRTLSGGNQQRVLFAKWLVQHPRVLLVDEPTRGVDVRGKHAIYSVVTELARRGAAVVVVSSEVGEVIGLAHRVLVLHRGRIATELRGAAITEQSIVRAAFGAPVSHEVQPS